MTEVINRFYQGPLPSGEYRFFQIAWVVDDLFGAAEQWVRVYGVGPFHVMPRRKQQVIYRGKPVELDIQLAVTQSGPVQLELIQQFDAEPSVYRDIYGQGQSGLHHMCTVTERYDETLEHYGRLGYPVIGQTQGAMRVAYIDTHRDFGFITELVEKSDGFLASLAKIAQTCAAWDGVDPIRMLTRDGYRTPEAGYGARGSSR